MGGLRSALGKQRQMLVISVWWGDRHTYITFLSVCTCTRVHMHTRAHTCSRRLSVRSEPSALWIRCSLGTPSMNPAPGSKAGGDRQWARRGPQGACRPPLYHPPVRSKPSCFHLLTVHPFLMPYLPPFLDRGQPRMCGAF